MNMKCGKLQTCVPCQTTCGMQQHSRIHSAGKTHSDAITRADMAGKAGGYRLHDGLSGWLVP